MTYEKAIEYLNSLLKFGIKPGFDRIKKLLSYVGNPHKNLKFIHVAGTNAKGSTCTFISSVLTCSNIKTGLFISPFIVDFRERMQINGEMISKESFAQLINYIIPFVNILQKNGEYITEFELITVAALLWFAREKCDIVVLEVGLGGRLDATNVIDDALISVITSVSLDHTNILGDSIKQIAYEKAGILKPSGVVVLYPIQQTSALSVIEEIAVKLKNKIIIPNLTDLSDVKFDTGYTSFKYKDKSFKIRLLGKHQVYNAITALTVIYQLIEQGYALPYDNIKSGLYNAAFPSRFEVMSRNPLIILDGAHNPSGASALAETIDLYLKKLKLIVIIGMLKDKDVNEVLKIIAPKASKLIITQPDNPRAMDKLELEKLALKFNSKCLVAKSISDAVHLALDSSDHNSAILVCGSLYLTSQIRPDLKHFCDF